jgi:hypothetical protein
MTRADEFSVRQQTEWLLRLEEGGQCGLLWKACFTLIFLYYLFTYLFIYLLTYQQWIMPTYSESIRRLLFSDVLKARDLALSLEVSQPTVSRVLSEMSEMSGEVVRIGAARSIQYALRDTQRGLPEFPVFRVTAEGQIRPLGTLVPVRPEGFVMLQADGKAIHSDGLPWWLCDMRPQGYLGRAFASRHAIRLGLPERLPEWSDTHALRALLAQGGDGVGNLLLGDAARQAFLSTPLPAPIAQRDKPVAYARLAREASRGEVTGSSAGGEQPKFVTYAETSDGARHVIVKFTEPGGGKVSERWRDLVLAEHLALDTLNAAGISAAATRIIDHADQRFLEIERFDRLGALGRRAVHSLEVLDAEFVGSEVKQWPVIARRLVDHGVIRQEASQTASLLWAFGTLIGNADMHGGNLSFIAEHGRPFDIAPAYDMLPMAFRPTAGGALTNSLNPANIQASVDNAVWQQAQELARTFLERAREEGGFSKRFAPCLAALENHLAEASVKIGRLG